MSQKQLYEDFFQKSNSYYLEQLNYFENGKKFRFSYAALIFGIFWLLYRKMYLEFFVVFIILDIEILFENNVLLPLIGIEQTKLISILVTITFLLILGIIGNNLYLRKATRTIKQAKGKFNEYEDQKKFLNKKGGVSFIYIAVIILIMVMATLFSK